MKQCLFIIFFLINVIVLAQVPVIPTPQKIEWGPKKEVATDRIKINFPECGFKAKKLAVELLQDKIKFPAQSPAVIVDLKFDPELNKPELYKMSYMQKGGITNVTITGATTKALFNGLMTFAQLLQKKNDNKVVLNLAKITDYPYWKNRFMGNYSVFVENNLKLAAKYKLGGVAFQIRMQWDKLKPEGALRGVFKNYGEAFALMKKYSQMEVLDFMLVYHIYAVRGKRTRPMFSVANPEDVKGLIERCRFAASNGINQIMICADDWTPMEKGVYVCPSKEERAKYGKCAGKAHGVLMAKLYKALNKPFPALKLSFCPPVYSLSGHGAESPKMAVYLKDLAEQLPKEVPVVWTGNQIVSREVTADHFRRFSKLLNGHKTMMWDNSDCYVYPIHKWKTVFYPGFAKNSSGIFVNTKSFDGGLWKTMFAINTNDYLWNPKGYDATASHRKIFGKFFPGKDYNLVQNFQNNFEKLEKMDSKSYDKDLMKKFKQQKKAIDQNIYKNRWVDMYVDRLVQKLESKLPTATVQLIAHPPVIDGKDSDSCYQNLKENVLVARYGKNIPAKMQTTFKMGFDRENIYVFIKAKLSKPLTKKKAIIKASSDLFKSQDLLEIFVAPAKPKKFIQIAFDFAGNKFNQLQGKRDWNPKWDVKVVESKEYWCAEVAIPFKMLEDAGAKPPTDKTKWRGNICREYNAVRNLQCWSPTYANRFLESDMFGYFEFKE